MESTIINILKFNDRTGRLLSFGQSVNVDQPRDTIIDGYNEAFNGTVEGFRGPCVVVTDGEGDSFEIEPFNLTIED